MAKKADKLEEFNPFTTPESGFSVPARWVKHTSTLHLPENDTSLVKTLQARVKEAAPRCTLYTADVLSFFPLLTSSAKDMFMYIAVHLPVGKDYMELREERYCTDLQVSRQTFFTARQQLVNRLIIPRTTRKHTYWVNPTYVFKGDRIAAFPGAVLLLNEDPFAALTRDESPA